jgi:hypothetical protein
MCSNNFVPHCGAKKASAFVPFEFFIVIYLSALFIKMLSSLLTVGLNKLECFLLKSNI